MRSHHDNPSACLIRFDELAATRRRSQRAGSRIRNRRRGVCFQPYLQELESRQMLIASVDTLIVTGVPIPSPAGVAESFTVTAVKPGGGTDTGYTGTVHFTSSDGQATLPANFAFTTANAGTHSFSVTLKTAGTQSITVTDTVTPNITGKESGITVNPGAARSLKLTGFPTTDTAGTANRFTVTAYDGYGNIATGFTDTVAFTSSDGQATLPATYTFTAANAGIDTFSATLKTEGTQSITATDTSSRNRPKASETGIAVNPAVAQSLKVTGFPTTPAGTANNVTVTAYDPYGNIATGYTGTDHFTSSDGQANLPANFTFTAANAGTHAFSITLKTAGTQSITATDTSTATITGSETGIAVNPAVAQSLKVTGFPTTDTAGAANNVTVTAYDPYGNIATGYTDTVHFTSSDGQAILPANYTFTAANAGTHTFSVTLKTAGTQSITATDTATSSITGSETGIAVNPAAAQSLKLTGFPTPDTAGTANNVTVTAYDAYGNVATGYTGTVHFTSSDSQASLPANYTFTAANDGTDTFSVTLNTVGTQSITATDTATSSITGSETGIVVQSAGPLTLQVTGFPTTDTAGAANSFTVMVYEPNGSVDTGYLGTVHFTSSDGQATLPANYTFTTANAGTNTFSATLKTAGAQSITATDTVTATITGSETGIAVNPAAAQSLKLTGFPTTDTAGTANNVTVTAYDAYGNIATGYTGTVHFTSSDSQATLPANFTFTAANDGTDTFSVTLKTAGTQSITATDTATATITGTESGITVNPAAAQSLKLTGFPTTDTAGTANNVTVTAYDAYGNIATGYTGTDHFTSSDSQAALPANYTFTAANAGTHAFSVTLKTAETQSITATDTATATITGSETGIAVHAAAAQSHRLTGFPTTDTAGVANNVTVTAYDPYGNIATGYTGTDHFTSSDGQATLPANYTFTAANAGTHAFSVTLKTAGRQSITATDTSTASITGSETGIAVKAAAAHSLKVTGFPTTDTAGTANNVTVTAYDAYGNIATGYTGTDHFTSSDGQATLPANFTFTAANAGTHAFSVTLKTAGTQSITATDTATATITGTESAITVNPSAAQSLKLSGFPTTDTAGTANNVTVTAYDAYGNIATGYTGTDHFTSSDSQATLPANYTFTAANAGTHAFSVTLKTAATQSITATDTTTATITGSETGIVVQAAAASSLKISGFPAAVNAGVSNNLTVTAYDAYANIATGFTGTVQFSSSDTQTTLPANYTFVAADAGSHTFSVTLFTPGTQSVTVTATNVSSASVSTTVNDVPPTVTLNDPSTGTTGTALSFSATATDVSKAVQAAGFTYAWAFGDGSTGTGANTTHTYTSAGTYTVTATATDEYGKSGTATGTISITSSSSPILFQDEFTSSPPSSAWSIYGGTWQINSGVLSQTTTNNANPTKAMVTNQTYPSNVVITAEVQVNTWTGGNHAARGWRRPLHQHQHGPGLQPTLSRYQPGSVPGRRRGLGQQLRVQLAGGHLVLVPARGKQRDVAGQGVGGRDRGTAELDVRANGLDRPHVRSAGTRRRIHRLVRLI